MANNGQKFYQVLEQYFLDTNEPTGNTKPNVATDPDYIEPSDDVTACPLNVSIAPIATFNPATIQCKFGPNRTTSATVGKPYDSNKYSPTYNKYFKLDGTFVDTVQEGDYFDCGNDAVLCPVRSTEPREEFVIESIKCRENAPRGSSATVAYIYDANEYSQSIGMRKTLGGTWTNDASQWHYFDYGNDAVLCSLEFPTNPDKQFVQATIRCMQNAPRTSAFTEAKIIDGNPNSPTYNKYLKGATGSQTWVTAIADGDYYPYELNVTMCPIAAIQTHRVYQNYTTSYANDYSGEGYCTLISSGSSSAILGNYIKLDPIGEPTKYNSVTWNAQVQSFVYDAATSIVKMESEMVSAQTYDNCGYVDFEARFDSIGDYSIYFQ